MRLWWKNELIGSISISSWIECCRAQCTAHGHHMIWPSTNDGNSLSSLQSEREDVDAFTTRPRWTATQFFCIYMIYEYTIYSPFPFDRDQQQSWIWRFFGKNFILRKYLNNIFPSNCINKHTSLLYSYSLFWWKLI